MREQVYNVKAVGAKKHRHDCEDCGVRYPCWCLTKPTVLQCGGCKEDGYVVELTDRGPRRIR